MQEFLKTLAILGQVDRIGRRADDRYAIALQIQRKLERRLTAVLHDHTRWLFYMDDFQYIFQRHRLEIQTIRGVVVGRNRFGITVDHDGFITVIAQRQCRMNAAVVKLNALSNAVRSTADHHDFSLVARLRFAFLVIA